MYPCPHGVCVERGPRRHACRLYAGLQLLIGLLCWVWLMWWFGDGLVTYFCTCWCGVYVCACLSLALCLLAFLSFFFAVSLHGVDQVTASEYLYR